MATLALLFGFVSPKIPEEKNKKQIDFTVPKGHGYNILGWSSFPSVRPIIHPSKFLIPEEEDDGGLQSV
jgi:hypothetical protein